MATSRYPGEKSNKRAPAPIGLLLEEARDASAQAGGIVLDRQRWRSAVGERIASRTEPGRLRAGVLTIHAASAAWAQELTFLSPEIVERVQALGLSVKSLRFVVREAVGSTTPRRAPARPVETVQKKPLPEELEARLARVADPELRAAIAEAASEWLARSPVSARERARAPRAAEERSGPTDPASRHSPGASRRRP
jgi:hypothetical protein